MARRLVPFDELHELVRERASLGESVTVTDIAEVFEVPRSSDRSVLPRLFAELVDTSVHLDLPTIFTCRADCHAGSVTRTCDSIQCLSSAYRLRA